MTSRANDPVAFVRGTMIDSSSPGGTPPSGQDFVPYGHVSRAGSTPQSYSLWGSSEESNTDSITSHKRRFGKSLCQIITGFTAVLILMAVIGIVGIAVYLGCKSILRKELKLHLRDTDQVIENIIRQEVESSSPLAFQNMKVDTTKIEVQRLLLEPIREELHEPQDQNQIKRKEDFEVVPLRNSEAGILRVRPTEIEENYNRRIEEGGEILLFDGNGKVGITKSYTSTTTTDTTKKTPTTIAEITKSEIVTQRTSKTKPENEIEILFHRVETTTDINSRNVMNNTTSPFPETDEPVNTIQKEALNDNQIINQTVGDTLATEGGSGSIFEDVMKILLGASSKDKIQWDNSTTTVILKKVTKPTEFFLRSTTTTTTTEALTTLRSLSHEQSPTTLHSLPYEHSPWKPINPDYGKPLEYKTSETDQEHSSREEQIDYVKFLPHEGLPHHKIDLSVYSTNSISTSSSSTPESLLQTSSSPLYFDSNMKLTSRKGHGITPSPHPVFISDSSHELQNSHIKLEGKSDIASSDPLENQNEALTEAPPTIKDIQSILENLLYIATMKPSTLLNLNDEENDKTTVSPKEADDKIFKPSLAEEKNSQSEAKLETKNFSEQSTTSTLRKHSGFKIGRYPLDKFRYQTHKYNTFTTTTEKNFVVPFTPKLSLPYNIWNALTTNKPLMLETDVVTSTSFEVNYGSTTESLTPVYIHSSTRKDLLDLGLNKTFSGSNFFIPIISGKDVQYVKVNRTKENYPNVVIVNLADSENRGLENIGPLLLDDKGKKIEFTPDFIASISYLLDKIKQQGQENGNSPRPETFRNFQETPLENNFPELKNVTLESALSYLSTFLVKETVPNNFHSLPEISAKDKDGFIPYSSRINDKSNVVQDPIRSFKKTQKKSGKSLKISPTLTLFVVRQKDEKRPRVISIFDKSPESKRSDRSKNSPIHVFKFKEGQSLDELLGEIFEAISKDKTVKSSSDSSKKGKERDPLSSKEFDDSQSQTVPAGEDSLKVIEALSKLLTDHYENYNLVFGSDNNNNNKPTPETKEPLFESTTIEVDTSPFKNSVETEYNEIYITTPKIETTSSVKYPENKTKSNYHKYHHELFPVMTRPLNPIRSTTPTLSTKFNLNTSEESVTPDSSDPLDVVTSIDISYSMLHGNKSSGCTDKQFKCSNNKCIPLSSRCNLIRDCDDNSDERYCNCSEMLKSLHYTRKICDGIIDCWDKSDETNCDWCSPGQFICTGYQKCVKQELVCDGVPDCPNGDDERDCVSVAPNIIGANSIDYHDEGYLMVRKKGTWGKLCVENFEKTVAKADVSWTVNDLGDAVCKTLTFDSSSRVERILDSSPPIFRSVSVPYFELSIDDNYFDAEREDDQTNKENQHSSMKRSLPLQDMKLDDSEWLKGSLLSFSDAFGSTHRISHKGNIHKRDVSSSSSPSSPSFERSLQFKETKCLNRDVVKIKCEELQCGIRPRASTQTASFEEEYKAL
ncbi:Low-density lipoprotein receptor-related protein 1B [Armadillidium nasatum]|uniref:Low-density lipoprotein receptor-related protein 1B n=1 Tax=Armadillidium nasatum TaxID=96803 RepID=A0A5N5SWE8_9CRUS|nr:Low-density lipoprotein receptor-related protein 1B [Armadillidium nasatum]